MRGVLTGILWLLLTLPAQAQQPASVEPASVAVRPRVALVLSGGGARGFAHIGVLRVLRELNVPVDMVVGTSMGAVVGGAYAAGYTVEQLETVMRDTAWNDVFTTQAPRQDMDFRRKEEDNRTISRFAFGLTGEGLVLPRGTFRSHVLDEVLRGIASPSLEVERLDDLPVPYRGVATDLVTGELVVLKDTTLFNAMRASMSIPGAFVPLELNGALLVDGGLARNLPVDVARDMGAQIVIAVNVGTPLTPREKLNSALDIAQQMINILTEQNVKQSIAELSPIDILISPQLEDVTFTDFDKGNVIAARGEAAARGQLELLRMLAMQPGQYAAREKQRIARAAQPREVLITDIRVQRTERSNPEVLRRALEINPGDKVSNAELAARIRKLGARGDFERIDFHLLGRELERTLIVQPTEVAWGGNSLRFGVKLHSDFRSSNQFDLLAAHTTKWINAYGGEWRNIMQIGGTRRFESELYQPVSPSQDWFVAGGFGYLASDADLYSDGRRVARWTFAERKEGFYVGRRLGLIGEVRLGRARYRTTADPVITGEPAGSQAIDYTADEAGLRIDTHDSAYFPRHGYGVAVGWQRARSTDAGLGPTARRAYGADVAVSEGPYTLLTGVQFADGGPGSSVALGGFLTLSGSPLRSITGPRALLARTVAYRQIGALPGTLGGAIFAGVSLELGNAFAHTESIRLGNMKRAAALVVGAETVLGPLYFGLGKTRAGESSFYLFLGQP